MVAIDRVDGVARTRGVVEEGLVGFPLRIEAWAPADSLDHHG